MSAYTLETIIMLIMFAVMIWTLIHLVYLMRKDSKALNEALKIYAEESVERGKRKAREEKL